MEYQEFNGIRFYQSTPRDYFRHSVGHTTILMHKYVWEFYNGKIPKGYDVHHIDRDRANNSVENLQLLTKAEHKKLHAKSLTDEEREWRRQNIIKNAVPKAKAWHKTEEGKAWHKKHYEANKEILHRKFTKQCVQCGKTYVGEGKAIFCSNACKSAYRRAQGLDLVERKCVICGKLYLVNKYSKSQCCSPSCRATLGHNRKTEGV